MISSPAGGHQQLARVKRAPRLSPNNSTLPHDSTLLKRSVCSLYTSPATGATVGVYESLTISWNSSCEYDLGTSIDLYLNVDTATDGSQSVHEWTGQSYSAGSLTTELKPSWWNASTGAGSVQAQVSSSHLRRIGSQTNSLPVAVHFCPLWKPSLGHLCPYRTCVYHLVQRLVSCHPSHGSPLLTPSPRTPADLLISRSYPTETTTAILSNYTGPSVESVASGTKSFSSSKLGAAIAVPILAVAAAICGYVLFNRYRKKPEKKRWSAAVDNRVSMISNGTAQPPRHSMASRRSGVGSRAGSVFEGGHSVSGVRRSGYGEIRPGSTFSGTGSVGASGVGVPSPLGAARPTSEMRQVGQGERGSRISFAEGVNPRPSFSSSRKGPASIYSRHSIHATGGPSSPNLPPPLPLPSPGAGDRLSGHRLSQGYFAPHSRYSTAGSVRSTGSGGGLAASAMGRSHTTEELSGEAMRSTTALPRAHARTKSSLQQVYRGYVAESIAEYPALAYVNQLEGKSASSLDSKSTSSLDKLGAR